MFLDEEDAEMKILEGILDSGSGAELQEARQTLNNTQKLTPEGGYIYPVKFNPWKRQKEFLIMPRITS